MELIADTTNTIFSFGRKQEMRDTGRRHYLCSKLRRKQVLNEQFKIKRK